MISADCLQQWETQPEVNHAGEYEVRLRRSDGVFRWFSIRREPLHDRAGALLDGVARQPTLRTENRPTRCALPRSAPLR